jgi:hypothetical protein
LDRNWPPALKESGAWPLSSLRQSFLNGSLTRLLDPDAVLKAKIVEFVGKGDFGLASGSRSDGTYDRIWFEELLSPDEVNFEANVFLVTKARAKALKTRSTTEPVIKPEPKPDEKEPLVTEPVSEPKPGPTSQTVTINLRGTIPPEMWNRLGTKLIPKLRSGSELTAQVNFSVTLGGKAVASFESEMRQILEDLGLADKIRIEES